MKHPVQIKTRLVCRGEEGEETIERTYRGTWARRDSRHLLHYADEENCGETHVLLSPLQADLRRRGQAVSRMVLAEGFLHESPYATPAGTFPLGVRTVSPVSRSSGVGSGDTSKTSSYPLVSLNFSSSEGR